MSKHVSHPARMLRSHKQTIAETLGRSPIHPFPARMAPGIALDALGEFSSPLRVLDPMAGSGTVLAVARARGHRAFGLDIDPLAVLLASVWTRTVDPTQVTIRAAEVLESAKAEFKRLPLRCAYPVGSDDETRQFVRFWFDDYARRQVASLSRAIRRVRDSAVRDVLWCGFSRLIITKSAGASLAMDLSHSRPHRAFLKAPVKPFNKFLSAVEIVAANCPQLGSDGRGPAAIIKTGDARKLEMRSGSIDLVLTSPPYLNAIDYMRCSKFSLVWMGYTIKKIRQIRGESVGAETASSVALCDPSVLSIIKELRLGSEYAPRDNAILARYIWDMRSSLSEVMRVLKPGARAVYVVGDSTVRGKYVRNSSIVATLALQQGMTLRCKHSRTLPDNRRYLPPPSRRPTSASIQARMRREIVLEFVKPAA